MLGQSKLQDHHGQRDRFPSFHAGQDDRGEASLVAEGESTAAAVFRILLNLEGEGA